MLESIIMQRFMFILIFNGTSKWKSSSYEKNRCVLISFPLSLPHGSQNHICIYNLSLSKRTHFHESYEIIEEREGRPIHPD